MSLIPQPHEIKVVRGHYIVDGYKYPRVTSILKVINKPALLEWYGKMGTKEAKEFTQLRAEFGTLLHKHIEELVQLEDDELNREIPNILKRYENEEMRGCILSWLNWKKDKQFGQRQTEALIISKKHGYAGTLDFYGKVNNSLFLADWKTSKDVYPEYFLQMSAYAEGIFEMTGMYPEYAGVVALHGDGSFIYKYINKKQLKDFFEVFKACKTIYHWQNSGLASYIPFEKKQTELSEWI